MRLEPFIESIDRWISANLIYDEKEYIFEILQAPVPTKFGIFSGRITQLHLYDGQDQKIAEYNKRWVLGPEKGTDAYKVVGKILKEYNFRKKGQKAA